MTQVIRVSQFNQENTPAYAKVLGPIEGNTPWRKLDQHLQFSIGGGIYDSAVVLLTIDNPHGKPVRSLEPHDLRTINVEQISPGLAGTAFAGADLYLADGTQAATGSGKVKRVSLGYVDGMDGEMFGLVDGKPTKREKAFFSFALHNKNPTAVIILKDDEGIYKG